MASKALIVGLSLMCSMGAFAQGPYAPAAGLENSTAIHKDSSIFTSWGENAEITLGYMNVNNPSAGYAEFGSINDALGNPDDLVVSLGDHGVVTYFFENPIINGDGPDFAIFENSFDDNFLELALVEVTSNGTDFFQFPSISLTQDSLQTDGFGSTDPTMIYNLAGKYRKHYGTPFDLAELSDIIALDLNNIIAIRIIDVIGNISGNNITEDSQGNIINDPYPTEFASSGFDLDAIGIIHTVLSITEESKPSFSVFPNPAKGDITISILDQEECLMQVKNSLGENVMHPLTFRNRSSISTDDWAAGVYFIQVTINRSSSVKRIVKI